MFKRSIAFFLLTACLLCLFPFAAYADVLIEPNNDFYSRHRDDCTPLNRSFYANGENGFVSVKEKPGSKRETAAIENGEILNIMFTYIYKGDVWGVTEIYTPDASYGTWPNGWVPMDQLLLVYDFSSFHEEHADAFYTYTGNYEALRAAQEIVLWSWPGSGITQGTLEALAEDDVFDVTHAYMDVQGREWGFVGYWFGHRNVWICLSDPANDALPAFNPPPQPELWQPGDTPASRSVPPFPLFIILLIGGLVAGTIILVRVFWKPNPNRAE